MGPEVHRTTNGGVVVLSFLCIEKYYFRVNFRWHSNWTCGKGLSCGVFSCCFFLRDKHIVPDRVGQCLDPACSRRRWLPELALGRVGEIHSDRLLLFKIPTTGAYGNTERGPVPLPWRMRTLTPRTHITLPIPASFSLSHVLIDLPSRPLQRRIIFEFPESAIDVALFWSVHCPVFGNIYCYLVV